MQPRFKSTSSEESNCFTTDRTKAHIQHWSIWGNINQPIELTIRKTGRTAIRFLVCYFQGSASWDDCQVERTTCLVWEPCYTTTMYSSVGRDPINSDHRWHLLGLDRFSISNCRWALRECNRRTNPWTHNTHSGVVTSRTEFTEQITLTSEKKIFSLR